ncbi:helix-turn-helix domain-containing protein [uncultured Oscillibacter sp.]|uniref:helix-turn-helix domain-containing protein n=1 Tax=uncultured Oscillibacter sp. TaxID=876091 RepID=UPI0025E9AA96|nr:helix-turn-helix transcriptional regulator [uncultured Oscillibacter sp.]
MEMLAKRLKGLREDRRMYQRELAKILGMSFRGYQNYETGQSEPKLATLIAIADYYRVSIDYLVGRTDDPDLHTSGTEG